MKIIECPRDAMQGIGNFIPTDSKIAYLNQLLKVGFDTLDAVSFVSPRAIPQLRDAVQVLEKLEWQSSASSLLAIVANVRGAEEASVFGCLRYLGFPLSISETFQQRNTNKSIAQAFDTVRDIQEICIRSEKTLVVYISMGFGNPYGDPYAPEVVTQFVNRLSASGVQIVSLADTIGISTPGMIRELFSSLTSEFPDLELGMHLHSHPATAEEKIQAAWDSGCTRIDGALKGFGGCPMAEDELTGNLPTEQIISFLDRVNSPLQLDRVALRQAMEMADVVFPSH